MKILDRKDAINRVSCLNRTVLGQEGQGVEEQKRVEFLYLLTSIKDSLTEFRGGLTSIKDSLTEF